MSSSIAGMGWVTKAATAAMTEARLVSLRLFSSMGAMLAEKKDGWSKGGRHHRHDVNPKSSPTRALTRKQTMRLLRGSASLIALAALPALGGCLNRPREPHDARTTSIVVEHTPARA